MNSATEEMYGGENFKMRYQGPDTGNAKVKVPASVLKHEKAGCRVLGFRVLRILGFIVLIRFRGFVGFRVYGF